ncbi:MAG: hypothetical protein ACSHYA_18575 [Opitutaceae bacterium]
MLKKSSETEVCGTTELADVRRWRSKPGGRASIGTAPSEVDQDWLALIKKRYLRNWRLHKPATHANF